MQFSLDDLLTPNEILADVLLEADDEDNKTFNKGWYISQIRQALEELSFDTFFHKVFQDFNFPSDLRLKIPKGAFNIRNIYLYSGEDCDVEGMQNVYIKANYYTTGTGKGTAMNMSGINDPFICDNTASNSVLFASLQNGYIMFGEACVGFEKVRVEFNGVATDISQAPFVPRQFRQAVRLFVMEKYYRNMKSRKPRFYSPLHKDTYNMLYKSFDGEWDKAQARTKAIDSKFRKDMGEYLSRGNW